MPKPFYQFDGPSFREDLFEYYILPAARWFLRDTTSAYLLPQASGSNWECSLAFEFLVPLSAHPQCPAVLSAEIRNRLLATGSWLLGQIREEGPGLTSWDGASWDTAVCLRSILTYVAHFETQLTPDELNSARDVIATTVNWLVLLAAGWEQNIRYGAGPPDLAKVLGVLVAIATHQPELLVAAERRAGLPPDQCIIDEIARVLIAMSERAIGPGANSSDTTQAVFWVDAFNSSEVIEALAAYIRYCETGAGWGSKDYEVECRELVYMCVTFIETSQEDGMWNGVADTPGTLLGYLRVVECLPQIDHVPHVVFKALRWMCENDKAVADGSFLHTSYVTVFYALALWETYESWALGQLPTSEVYDISLWRLASPALMERSRRLELELRMEDLRRAYEKAISRAANRRSLLVSSSVAGLALLAGLGVLVLSGAIEARGQLSVVTPDRPLLWGVVAVWLPLASSAIGATYAYTMRRVGRER